MTDFELVVINGKQKGQRFPLGEGIARIGRDSDCEILLLDQSVSRRHARLIRKDAGWLVEDMRSRNGTYLDGLLVDSPSALGPESIVQIGLNIRLRMEPANQGEKVVTSELPNQPSLDASDLNNSTTGQQPPRPAMNADDARRASGTLNALPIKQATIPVPGAGPAPFSLRISGGKQAGELYPLSFGQHGVGRAVDNTIVLHNPDISNHHAVIHVNHEGLWLQDLGSRNGTYTNSRTVHGPTWLNPGDMVQFGATLLAKVQAGIFAGE
jgi:pSer/pThr/pTyr-binding forkhead associated (FHA) protein